MSDQDLHAVIDGLVAVTGELTKRLLAVEQRIGQLEDRFREHGHIGSDATVGLGSCWDGS